MDKRGEKKFFPYYFFEISVIALLVVEAVLVLAVLFPSSVGREIDFSAQYSPRPEWYFLFLYELTKYFPGQWTFVGAILLPGLVFALILLAPFLEGEGSATVRERRIPLAVGFGLLTMIVTLTALAVR